MPIVHVLRALISMLSERNNGAKTEAHLKDPAIARSAGQQTRGRHVAGARTPGPAMGRASI